MKVTAAVVNEQEKPFTIEQLELADPGPGEILVRIVAAGICHTDVLVRDQWYPVPLPAVLGHEGSGVVEKIGSAVRKVSAGDHVALSFGSCGACVRCAQGQPAYCINFFAANFSGGRLDGTSPLSRDGERINWNFFGQSSFATYALATERNVVKVPKDVPLEIVGPLGCGIQTGAGGVLNSLRPHAGSSIAIYGTGAVGMSAIMAAAAVGCTTIIGVDLNTERLEMARGFGATHVIDAGKADTAAEIASITGGLGVNYAIETTGSPKVLRQAVDSLALLGVCGLIGGSRLGTEVTLDMNNVLFGRTLRGIVEGDSNPDVFIPQLLDLHRTGRFPFDKLIQFYPIEKINEACEDSHRGKVLKPVLRLS
jgi:aryl-alcohol dehydrogenase